MNRLPTRAPNGLTRSLHLELVERGARGSAVPRSQAVTVEQSTEGSGQYAQRALQALARLERARLGIASARLVVGRSCSPASVAARRLLLLGLAAHARNSGRPLVLSIATPSEAEPAIQTVFLGLVDEALREGAGMLEVRLRFDAPVDAGRSWPTVIKSSRRSCGKPLAS